MRDYLLALPDGGLLGAYNISLSPPGATGARIPEAQVVRLDSAGRVVWKRRYGGAYTQVVAMVAQPNGSYVLAGQHFRPVTPGPGYLVSDAWVQRIRITGDTIGTPQYIGTLVDGEYVNDARPTPNGGLLLAGFVGPNWYSGQPYRGWLVQFDSLGQVQWQQQVAGQVTTPAATLCQFDQAWPLQDGSILVKGARRSLNPPPNQYYNYLARYVVNAAGTGAAPTWEQFPTVANTYAALSPTGELTMTGRSSQLSTPNGGRPGEITRFRLAGVPYRAPVCRTPPVAQAGFARPAPDSLRLVGFSTPGPRYAELLAWRWELGDGTHYDGPAPPPRRYAPVPPPGTPVRLTVTNNLGCSSTLALYPWGLPTATQQARAAAGRAALYPNPATGSATLALAGLPPGRATVQVFDVLGRAAGPARAVAVAASGAATLRLELAGWPAGLYAVRVQAGPLSFARRLVVQ